MTAVIYATPPVQPAPPPPLDYGWERLEMWFVDRYGVNWNVSDWERSGAFLMHGVKGMEHPKLRHQDLDFANTDGASWNGLLVDPREVWWPVYLFQDSTSAEYLEHIRNWWDALDPWHTIRWYVRSPNGEIRHLDVRMYDAGDPGSEFDDVYYGWAIHGISGRAHDPYWKGEVVHREFSNAQPVPFFGPAGDNGPPFRPSRDSSVSTARINNPGPIRTALTWTLRGPIQAGAVLGFGSSRIDVPVEVAVDQTLKIDTNPDMQLTTLDGVDVTGQMTGRYDMTLIQPGEDIPLTITFAGNGKVEVDLEPRYWRAYA